MVNLNLHNFSSNQSIIFKLVELYKLWHNILPHFPKTSRYRLGLRIDSLFIEIAENLFIANYSSKKEKLPFLTKSSKKIDLLKFLLQISWEIKALDDKKYLVLSQKVDEAGKMIGGWIKGITNPKKTSA